MNREGVRPGFPGLIVQRVTFKVLVYVFKCFLGIAPGYLSSCLALTQPSEHAHLLTTGISTQLLREYGKTSQSASVFASVQKISQNPLVSAVICCIL